MNKSTFITNFNDASTGAFKDLKPITAADLRTLVTDLGNETLIWPESTVISAIAPVASNDYVVTFPITVSAYTDVKMFAIRVNQTNTDIVTITSALGTTSLCTFDPNDSPRDLYPGELKASRTYLVVYDGGIYLLIGDFGNQTVTRAYQELNTSTVQNGFSSPKLLAFAPGAGKMIKINGPIVCKMKFGSAAFATNTNFKIYYGAGITAITASITSLLNSAANKISIITSLAVQDLAANIENQAIYFIVDTGNPTSGTGSSLVIDFKYEILTL